MVRRSRRQKHWKSQPTTPSSCSLLCPAANANTWCLRRDQNQSTVHRAPNIHLGPCKSTSCSRTQAAAALLLIVLTGREHILVMNVLIHLLLAFCVQPLLGQLQSYFGWKLLVSGSHLKGDPAHFALHTGQSKLLQALTHSKNQLSFALVSSN